ncbi:hypothetical protein [Pelagibius sp. 7325]|uniref:hypothetical protein n=1 Tax=Pelagibius sp. 7325 TaxID=3131994 RepID=UPI0030ED74D5
MAFPEVDAMGWKFAQGNHLSQTLAREAGRFRRLRQGEPFETMKLLQAATSPAQVGGMRKERSI